MKTIRFSVILAAVGLWIFTSCESDEDTTVQIDTEAADIEASTDDVFEDIDQITEAVMDYFNLSGRVAEGEEDERIMCANKSHDRENQVITIDFGEGCIGPGGRERKGKIIITYTAHRFMPGAVMTHTFEDFYVDGVKIDGVRTKTNISESLETNPTFEIMLEGGKLTWEDGSFATREAQHIRTWKRTGSPLNDEVTWEGSANGLSRKGIAYAVTITAPIVFKRSCMDSKVYVPVQGIKVIKRDGMPDVTIDYGDGTCDNMMTVSSEGNSKEVEIKRFRKG